MFRDYDGRNLRFHELVGTPQQIGRAHAEQLRDGIMARIDFFNQHSGATEADLDANPAYARWRDHEIEYHAGEFPHLVAETEAIAKYSGLPVHRVFDLTFSGWSVVRQHAQECCSLAAMVTSDGTPSLLSTLDDAAQIWPAMARYVPAEPGRRSFIATARPGTAGAGRGMNDAGLWIGTASCGVSACPDTSARHPRPFTLTYLLRAMLERCTTVPEALDFCRQYGFCANLLIADAQGRVAGVHQTFDGPYDVTEDGCVAMTNSIADDLIIYELTRRGMYCAESVATSRPRRGFIRDYIQHHNRSCTFEQFVADLARRDHQSSWSVNHSGTVYITAAAPQRDPHSLWVCRPLDAVHGDEFIRLRV